MHGFVIQEYTRACLISYESLPKDADRDGWGRPGTPLYFLLKLTRSRKMGYPLTVRASLDRDSMGRSLLSPFSSRYRPRSRRADDEGRSPLHYYDSAVQLARQAEREPTEREFEVGITAADEIKKILSETREEMLEGSTPDLSKLPLAL